MRTVLPSARLVLALTVGMLLSGCTTVHSIICERDPIDGQLVCTTVTRTDPLEGDLQSSRRPLSDLGHIR